MLKKNGFTLLEILISAMILALVMYGLMSTFSGVTRYIKLSRSETTVAELARFFFGNLSVQVRQDEWGENCVSNRDLCGPNTTVLDRVTYNITYSVNNTTTDPFMAPQFSNLNRVNITIKWNETSF